MKNRSDGNSKAEEKFGARDSPISGDIAAKRLRSQILRFGMVGLVGFAVNAGMVSWLADSIGPGWSQALIFPFAASVTWWLNRRYTFRASGRVWHNEWVRYVAANILGWTIVNGIYFFLILNYKFFYRNPSAALFFGTMFGFISNFIFSKLYVFGKSHD